MFNWRDDSGGVARAVTSRSGGVSKGPYAGLNLGAHVADDVAAVARNRSLVASALGVDAAALVFMDQCHGNDVAHVEAMPLAPPKVDAMVTTNPDLVLAVLVADCVPVLLESGDGRVVGVTHAGRKGMLGGAVRHTVEAMSDLGARELRATIGPSVCGRCYEVPEAMCDEGSSRWPAARAVSWTGTPALDVAAGVVSQLVECDVQVRWLPGCSREDPCLFSHRRDGVTGRYAGLIRATR